MGWVIAASAFALVAVLYLACYIVFCCTVRRRKKPRYGDASALSGGNKNKLRVFNRSGYEWIENNPHEEVYINSFDNLKLRARLYTKKDNEKYLVLVHGYRSSARRDFGGLVPKYYDHGWNILLVDQRSHEKSEGKYITFGSLERFDVVSWAEYLTDRFGEHITVILGGMSMGSTSVLGAAGLKLPVTVKGIIADCGFSSPKEIIVYVGQRDYRWIPVPKKQAFYIIEFLSKIHGFSLRCPPTYETIKKNSLPVLFIHGKADGFVPPEMSMRCWEAAECEKSIVLIDGAVHAESAAEDTHRYLEATFGFLDKITEKEQKVCLPQ